MLSAIAERVRASAQEIEKGAEAAEFAVQDPAKRVHLPSTPLRGYQIIELTIGPGSPALGRRLDQIQWPDGARVVAVTEERETRAALDDVQLKPGERVIVLAPAAEPEPEPRPTTGVSSRT